MDFHNDCIWFIIDYQFNVKQIVVVNIQNIQRVHHLQYTTGVPYALGVHSPPYLKSMGWS